MYFLFLYLTALKRTVPCLFFHLQRLNQKLTKIYANPGASVC